MQEAVREVGVPREVCAFAAGLVSATHPDGGGNGTIERVKKYVRLGSSPRGLQSLILGAKVRALCEGRDEITADDVRSVAVPALSHRLLFNFEGQADRVDPNGLIRDILAARAMSN